MPGLPTLQRIRKRADGACGFLSPDNRCRLHEELGAAKKPLTCRLFPYAFHPAADGVVVTASFGCPTIVANQGTPIATGESLASIEALRKEWFATHSPKSLPSRLVDGRPMDPRSARVLREALLAMLKRDSVDLRANIRRIAVTIDDLTRSRVLALTDADFAEYVSLTVPHAAATDAAVPHQRPSAIGRLLQYGFLFAVTAIRSELEDPGRSRWSLRLRRLRMLAHFHGLAPGRDRVNVKALRRQRLDLNDPEIRPVAENFLRASLATLGAQRHSIVDELALAFSQLNAAVALAVMNADAAGKPVDRAIFSDAVMEAADVSHARNTVLDWILKRFSGQSAAIWHAAR